MSVNNAGKGKAVPSLARRAPTGNDHLRTVRRINATLRGPVLEILGEMIPEVRALPQSGKLEALMDNLPLLDRCFQAFRANPDRFRHLLINRYRVPVQDATAALECGRSLDDVLAMVVRTAAKRHFRAKLDGSAKPPLPLVPRIRRPKGVVEHLISLFSAPGPVQRQRRSRTRGEQLYDACKDYLRHDWQVPLVPEYSTLTPNMVHRLGARLLDYRLAEDIRRFRADPDNPPPPTPILAPGELGPDRPPPFPAPISVPFGKKSAAAKDDVPPPAPTPVPDKAAAIPTDRRARLDYILSTDGQRLRTDHFASLLLDPQIRKILPNAQQTIRITNLLGRVGGLAVKMLVGELGLRQDQLTVLLVMSGNMMGSARFEAAFGMPGRAELIGRVIEKAKAAKISQDSSLSDVSAFVLRTFSGLSKRK